MKLTALLGAAFATLSCALADDNADISIYLDYPAGQWSLRGSAQIDPLYAAQKHSYLQSIFVTLAPGADLVFQHVGDGQEAGNISAVEFWVCGIGGSGQDFYVRATTLRNYAGGPPQSVSRYGRIYSSRWRRIRVPLADLDILPGERAWNISFVGIAGSSTQTFCVDDVRLIKPPHSTATYVNVSATTPVKVLSKQMFGATTFAYDYFLSDPVTADRTAEAGVQFLTFPGGGNADEYDWRNNCRRPSGEIAPVDTLGYLQFADAIGADKMIAVNYGTGTPEEAADWVRYANIEHNGNVMYWSIGNECFYTTETDNREGIYRHDAETYAEFVRECIVQMKAVDPRIKIGIVGLTTPFECAQRTTVVNPRTGVPENGWSPVLLTRLREWGTMPDYYDCHFYPVTPGMEDDSFLMQMAGQLAVQMRQLRPMLTDYLGDSGVSMPVHLTETNGPWGSPGKQTTSITSAIYLADFWGRSCQAGLESFVWYCLHAPILDDGNLSPSLNGTRPMGTYGILSVGYPEGLADPLNTRYPTFYALKCLKLFARPGDTMVEVSTNNELVSAYASVSATTGRLKLLVINRAARKDINVQVRIANYLPANLGVQYRYSAREDTARSDIVRSTLRLSPRTYNGVSTIRVAALRYSINVIEL